MDRLSYADFKDDVRVLEALNTALINWRDRLSKLQEFIIKGKGKKKIERAKKISSEQLKRNTQLKILIRTQLSDILKELPEQVKAGNKIVLRYAGNVVHLKYTGSKFLAVMDNKNLFITGKDELFAEYIRNAIIDTKYKLKFG